MDFSKKRIIYSLIPALLLTIIMWVLTILEWGMDWNFTSYGILPRSSEGLIGIVTATVLHGGFTHLLTNTPPLLFLGWCLYYFYKDMANKTVLCLWLLTGVLTWIIGRDAWHIGASGLIYALAFFLFFSGIFRRNTRLSAITFIVVFLYGGLIWNMMPVTGLVDPKISWEGHLSGAFSGFIIAFAFRHDGPPSDMIHTDLPDDEYEDENPYWEIKNEEPRIDNQSIRGSSDTDIKKSSIHSFKKEEKPDSK